ncbi:MAG: hypothetical protein ACK4GO_07000 [Gemmobacter sp.]
MFTHLIASLSRDTDSAAADAAGIVALFVMLIAALAAPGLM